MFKFNVLFHGAKGTKRELTIEAETHDAAIAAAQGLKRKRETLEGVTFANPFDAAEFAPEASVSPSQVEASELASEPVAEPASELASEPVAEPASELASEPVAEPASELASEPPTGRARWGETGSKLDVCGSQRGSESAAFNRELIEAKREGRTHTIASLAVATGIEAKRYSRVASHIKWRKEKAVYYRYQANLVDDAARRAELLRAADNCDDAGVIVPAKRGRKPKTVSPAPIVASPELLAAVTPEFC